RQDRARARETLRRHQAGHAAPLRRDRRQDRRGDLRPALTARHVGVAAFPVNNRPKTGKRSPRSFPTAAGWLFVPALLLALPKSAVGPRPHAEEHRSANGSTNAPIASERCDASRSMRAIPCPSSSFETRAGSFDFAEAFAHARSSG